MSPAELHTALADVARIARRGGYDVDEEAEVLARVVKDYADAAVVNALNEAREVVEQETDAYPGASPAITSGIAGGFDQWAMGRIYDLTASAPQSGASPVSRCQKRRD